SGVGRGARVPEEGLHPVLRDELELLQLAHTPLLIRREEAATVQLDQLLFVALVLLAEPAEIVVFYGESLDQGFRVGHADLLTRLWTLPQPASVPGLYSPALRPVKAWNAAADGARSP